MQSVIVDDEVGKHPGLAREIQIGELDLGTRLRRARIAVNLSLRQLAAKADVSNTTISLIEQNRTSPSVGSLQRILDALPISMADFFHDEIECSVKIFYLQNELDQVASGTILSLRLPASPVGSHMQMDHIFYRSGADTGDITLPGDDEKTGIVVRGYLEVTVNGTRRSLGLGMRSVSTAN